MIGTMTTDIGTETGTTMGKDTRKETMLTTEKVFMTGMSIVRGRVMTTETATVIEIGYDNRDRYYDSFDHRDFHNSNNRDRYSDRDRYENRDQYNDRDRYSDRDRYNNRDSFDNRFHDRDNFAINDRG